MLCHSRVSESGRIPVPPDRVGDYIFNGKISDKGSVMNRAIYVKESAAGKRNDFRPKTTTAFLYPTADGSPAARTRRMDDGKGGKTIWQEYWIDDDRLKRHWTKDVPNSRWCCVSDRKVKEKKATAEERKIYQAAVAEIHKDLHLYRVDEAKLLADEHGLAVLICEGEVIVNLLLDLGIPATTSIGGAGKWHQYGSKHGNYTADLVGVNVVLSPDCDAVGVKHADEIALALNGSVTGWLYANPTHQRWQQSPAGGYDLADWVGEMRGMGMKDEAVKERVLGAIGERLSEVGGGDGGSGKSDEGNGQPVHKLKADYNAIREVIGAQLQFNTLKNVVELDGNPIEVETAKQELVIEHDLWLKSGKEEVADLVVKAAKLNSYNPIEDYLNQCAQEHGDDTSILFRFAERYFGQSDPIHTIFAIRFLVGAVARIFEPGCKFDTALILQGGQGIRKSTFFKVLASPDWFDDSLGSVSDKDEKMKLHQTWFMEWAELETVFKRKDISSTKAFLSSATDRLRLPYGRSVVELPRKCVIVGTTNQDEFLNDVTGNRRFWVIPVKTSVIDTSTLAEERDRIWAAAVALYRKGEFWHLIQCEDQAASKETEDYQSEDAWTQPIAAWARATAEYVTTANILNLALKMEVSRQDKAAQMRVSDIMRSMGWEKTRKRVGKDNLRLWQPSKDAVPTSLEVGTEVGTTIDLSQSSLYQYFQDFNKVNVPTVPTVPTLLEGRTSSEICDGRKNGSVDSLRSGSENSPLGKVGDTDGTVGTRYTESGFQRSSQVGTEVKKKGQRLEHPENGQLPDPIKPSQPWVKVGAKCRYVKESSPLFAAYGSKEWTVTAIRQDGQCVELTSGDEKTGWVGISSLSPVACQPWATIGAKCRYTPPTSGNFISRKVGNDVLTIAEICENGWNVRCQWNGEMLPPISVQSLTPVDE